MTRQDSTTHEVFMPTTTKQFYRLSELAAILGISKKSVDKLRREGGLDAVKFGKALPMWMVPRSEVLRLAPRFFD
jgi:predicted DNA-binding transcriptional regulator AlpA